MRLLVVRIGAFGDVLVTTPLLRYLKSEGHHIYYLGSEQARDVLESNPNVEKFIYHKRNSIKNEELGDYFERIAKENGCDKVVNLCESLEVRLSCSPDYPQWMWTKQERKAYCNRNFYEYCFEHAGHSWKAEDLRPEMFFTEEEEKWCAEFREKNLLGFKTIMWGLSGSARQKCNPYVPYMVGDLLKEHKDLKVILVGGDTCRILESGFPNHGRILKNSGKFSFRQSALLAKYVDLVVSPDTGFLHAAGCWKTPKIGLLTHTTRENVTKHFLADFSLESTAPCAPCFRLIDDTDKQCPVELASNASLCMGKDYMKPEEIVEQIKEVLCLSKDSVVQPVAGQ